MSAISAYNLELVFNPLLPWLNHHIHSLKSISVVAAVKNFTMVMQKLYLIKTISDVFRKLEQNNLTGALYLPKGTIGFNVRYYIFKVNIILWHYHDSFRFTLGGTMATTWEGDISSIWQKFKDLKLNRGSAYENDNLPSVTKYEHCLPL